MEGQNWCRRGESNPRPRDYETLALPLSYAGMRQPFMLRIRLQRCQGVLTHGRVAPIAYRTCTRPISMMQMEIN